MSAPVSAGNTPMTLAEFNAAPQAAARSVLEACLDIDRWVAELDQARPYPNSKALQARASASADDISWDEVAGALARHPRIGERATGAATDVALSAAEQAGVTSSDEEALAAGNRAYEERFGHIYLICAAGLSGAEMVAALRERLTNDDERERLVVMEELRKIAALRLTKAIVA